MKILALNKAELEKIYEYTYKLGMMTSEEEALGYLPDKLYKYKAKLEGAVGSYLTQAYDDMIDAYDNWIDQHTEEGWKNSLFEFGNNIVEILVYLVTQWGFDKNYLYELVLEELGGSEALLRGNGTEYLAETYGLQYIEALDPNTTDETERKILDRYNALEEDMRDYEAIVKVVDEFSLEDTIVEFTLDSGYSGLEELKGIYPNIKDLYSGFEQIIEDNAEEILTAGYKAYLEHFSDAEGPGNKSLEENIEDIQLGLEALYEFKDGTLKDRLVAFQYALTVAHHYGTMADHVLGVQRGRGEQILNALSSGDKVEEWNAELEKVLGHIPGTLSKEIPQLWIDPEAVG